MVVRIGGSGAACIAAGLRYAALHTVLGRASREKRGEREEVVV